jgi:Sugar-transfer associated ATP-grasp
MTPSRRVNEHLERFVYRVAGLPLAARTLFGSASSMDKAFGVRYWHPRGFKEWISLVEGLALWPLGILGGALWYSALNGRTIKRRGGKGVTKQFAEQLRLYFSAGVLAPWYYLFSLDEDGSSDRAKSFLQRFETKTSLFPLLKQSKGSPLNNKARFAEHCASRGLRTVELIAHLDGKRPDVTLPDRDLFVKRATGRGGRGAERWNRVAPFVYEGPEGERLSADELLARLVRRSRHRPQLIQPRLSPHPELAGVTAGALPTTRIVTCLNERGEPEAVIALFRMSIGSNSTVDNMHAGGIAAQPDIESGKLSRASDLGMDARIGWHSVHPDTGEQIEGRVLPYWAEAKRLAVEAHRAFSDRVVVGWDIAILEDGPILIEGNGNPDMDIIQRFMRVGLKRHRFGELIAHHLRERLYLDDRTFHTPESASTSAVR